MLQTSGAQEMGQGHLGVIMFGTLICIHNLVQINIMVEVPLCLATMSTMVYFQKVPLVELMVLQHF